MFKLQLLNTVVEFVRNTIDQSKMRMFNSIMAQFLKISQMVIILTTTLPPTCHIFLIVFSSLYLILSLYALCLLIYIQAVNFLMV